MNTASELLDFDFFVLVVFVEVDEDVDAGPYSITSLAFLTSSPSPVTFRLLLIFHPVSAELRFNNIGGFLGVGSSGRGIRVCCGGCVHWEGLGIRRAT